MPIRLDARSADFPAQFRAFLDGKREASADVEQAVRAILADVVARGDAALIDLTRKFDRVDLGAIGLRVTPAELDAATAASDGRRARCPEARARPHRGLSPPPASAGRSLDRPARRRARPPLDRGRGGRPLRAGRHRGLSVLRADERRSGKSRRLSARRHGGTGAGRQAQSAGAGGRAARGRRRDLPHRRRAGGGGACPRHRHDRAGRQDRRAGQRLCGGGEAPGVRQGRHRHDRRSERSADHRRPRRAIRNGSPPICWPRPSTTPPRNRS